MSDLAEELKFSITLSATYWGDRNPEFYLTLDGENIAQHKFSYRPTNKGLPLTTEIDLSPDALETFEFSHVLEPGDHVLGIKLFSKTDLDTRGFVDDKTWLKDVMLHVESIKIDDIDIKSLVFEQSKYVLATGEILTNTNTLHKNGEYQLYFTTPIYMWFLEHL